MVDRSTLEASKEIQRRTGRTFFVATRLLPERVRRATYVLYAFFRVADDVVDDPSRPPADRQRAELERIRASVLGDRADGEPPPGDEVAGRSTHDGRAADVTPSDGRPDEEAPPDGRAADDSVPESRGDDEAVLRAFRALADQYDVPDREIEAFLDAMERDVDGAAYETHDDLGDYLRGSSVAVANMMLAVMDGRDRDAVDVDRARPHARALGEAFQLTNFLRDVREDVRDYDRVYLPARVRRRHGVDREQIETLDFDDRFAAMMAAELRRTERLYRRGVAGIRYLPADCQFGVLLAAVLYAEHHRLVRDRGYDVLSARPTLSTRRRLTLAARTWLRWQFSDDPEAVFYAVSAVDREPTSADHGPGTGAAHDDEPPLRRKATGPVRQALAGLRSLRPEVPDR